MPVAIVNELQPVQVKEQQSKLTVAALAALDLQIEYINEVTIVRETS